MDYNIYIHDETSNSAKPTQPRQGGNANTAPKKKESQEEKEAKKDAAIEQAAKTKFGKVMLALYAVGKVTKGVVSSMIPFITRETGDYRFATAWNNTWQSIKNYTNPISYAMGAITYKQETMLANQRLEQERLLVGDSFINDSSRKMWYEVFYW